MRAHLLARTLAALKAARLTFSGWGGSPWMASGRGGYWDSQHGQPGSGGVDWALLAGDLWQSSVVAICLCWIARNITAPDICIQERKKKGDESEDNLDHPLCALVNDPNPYYGSDALWAATAASYCTSGNAYWVKAVTDGRPCLYYIPHFQIRPVWPEDGSKFITGYAYKPDHRTPIIYRPSDVIHFRFGLDLYNYRLGWAPLGPQLRQVATDNEASTYEAVLVNNMGIVPVMLSPASPEAGLDPDQRQQLEEKIQAKYAGQGRGKWMIVGVPMKSDMLGLSPDKLAIPNIRHVSESRICASIGIPPMVVGLTSGEGSMTYANKGVARREAWQDCLIPMLKTFGGALTHQLGPDFGLGPNEQVGFDLSDVEALAEDAKELSDRAIAEFQGGVRTRNQAAKLIGLPEVKGAGDVYLLAKGAMLVDQDGEPVGGVPPLDGYEGGLMTRNEARKKLKLPAVKEPTPEDLQQQALPAGQDALPQPNGNGNGNSAGQPVGAGAFGG